MRNIELLDSLHTKIIHSKLAETITEQEIDALIDCKEQMKETYNQALEDALDVVEWDGYTLDIKKRIEQLKR